VIPPVFINSPTRIKRGTARRTNESIPPIIVMGAIKSCILPLARRYTRQAKPMATEMGVLITMKRITMQTRVITRRPGGADPYSPMNSRAAVKTTIPIPETQVEVQSFRLKILCNWYNKKISPAVGRAANTHAMEKCMVME
jgi:hypothetical protein